MVFRNKHLKLRNIIAGSFLFAAVCMIVSGCGSKAHYEEIISGATVVENPEIYDAGLEGKYILITGPVKTFEGAFDDFLGIELDGPLAYRSSQTLYEQVNDNRRSYKWSGGGSTVLMGTAAIGEYKITGDCLKYMIKDTYRPVSQEMADVAGLYYWDCSKYSPGKYLLQYPLSDWKADQSKANEGATRYWYDVKIPETEPMTVFGYVQDGYLVDTEEYEIQYLEGSYSKEEFIEKLCK